MEINNQDILIYQNKNGNIKLDVHLQMKPCGLITSKWQIYLKVMQKPLVSISTMCLMKVN